MVEAHFGSSNFSIFHFLWIRAATPSGGVLGKVQKKVFFLPGQKANSKGSESAEGAQIIILPLLCFTAFSVFVVPIPFLLHVLPEQSQYTKHVPVVLQTVDVLLLFMFYQDCSVTHEHRCLPSPVKSSSLQLLLLGSSLPQ